MARQGAAGSGNRGGQAPQRQPGRKSAASARVFRRRRAVFGALVLAVLMVLVGGVIFVVGLIPRGTAAAPASPLPSSRSSSAAAVPPSATPTPTAPATPVCDQNLVTVTAAVDAQVYAPGQNPVLELKVTNGGTAPCEVNIGTSQMEFLVMSGNDRIFSSKDCQEGNDDLTKTIVPGASETANFPWQRNRTAPGCTAVPVIPKPGYYVYQATLGQRTSNKVAFELQ
ncbi:MAG: hypothetical protein M3017_14795 [Actinomycetota bacterium]|nr:hypothetical protein [Actinomycetota bacterium]